LSGRRSTPARLSDRQRAFVDEYLIDLNVAAAARRCGYAPSTAHAADKLVTPAVLDAIDQAMAQRAERTRVAADKVVAELAKLAFANMADYFTIAPDGAPRIDFTGLSRDDAAAIQTLTIDYYRPPVVRKRARKVGQGPQTRRTDIPLTPRRVRIHLADKRAALIDLARHLGIHAQPQSNAKAEEDPYADYAKYIHCITGVPRPHDPTGQLGFMMQISGPDHDLPDGVLRPGEDDGEL
jgi:phage terminase small subunit